MTSSLAEQIAELWPLSEQSEYADEFGLAIASHHPKLWRSAPADIRLLPLAQARGYAFLQWLELTAAKESLQDQLAELIASGPAYWRSDLEASYGGEPFKFNGAIGAPPAPVERSVHLYRSDLCANYAYSYGQIDKWTTEALRGCEVTVIEPSPASDRELAFAHDRCYIGELFALARVGGRLTAETVVSPESEGAVRAAAGSVLDALEAKLAGSETLTLCLSRPGSHHASFSRAGGTCLVNNLAICARSALRNDLRRVAIIDIDAHHGNGTEALFLADPRVFTFSIHQRNPFYPGTGNADERGRGAGRGTNLNVPVVPGASWLEAFITGLSEVEHFAPELVLVEFSTDAHSADSVSQLQVSDDDFRLAARAIEALGAPVIYELGASLSERAWVGGLRGLLAAGR